MNLLRLFNRADNPLAAEPAPPRVSIALGGGGARGLAHLGVMQAIEESPLHTTRIVGVSIGGLIGAMCALDGDVAGAQRRAIDLLHSPGFRRTQELLLGTGQATSKESEGGLFSWYDRLKKFVSAHRKLGRAVTSPSLLSDWPLAEVIECLVPDINIEETQTPLSIVAADLLSGHKVVLETGRLRTAVQASMSIPGIFPPVSDRGMLLCDIGVLDSIPLGTARSYPHDVAVGVDVGQAHLAVQQCDTALDVMMRMEEIGERILRRNVLEKADLIVRPDVDAVAWFDFTKPETLIDAGYRAGWDALRPMSVGAA